MPTVSPSLFAAAGLIGGYAAAQASGRREVGGLVFSAAGAWCGRQWRRRLGVIPAAGLSSLYTAAMGGSHPLAKKLGAWPSVLVVAGMTALASEVLLRRAARR